MNPQELDQCVRHEALPFLRRALKGVFLGYEAGHNEAKSQFEPDEASDLIGYLRRAKIEANLRGAAELSVGTDAFVKKANSGNWTHTEVHTDHLIITASRVQYPAAPIPAADFRQTLATNGQLSLLEQDEAHKAYAVLTHSKSVWPTPLESYRWGHLPGSAHLVFPSPALKTSVYTMNLFSEFPEVVAESTPTEWGEVELELYVERGRRGYRRRSA